MAKLTKGIFGPFEGKLGPIIGCTWKGVPYIKMANQQHKGLQSPAQQAHRLKFAFLTQWLRPLHPFLMSGYRNLAVKNTQINLAFSYNFKAAVQGTAPDFSVAYENVRISRGDLPGICEPQIMLIAENTLQLQWKNEYGTRNAGAFNDQLLLVLYNSEIGFADGLNGAAARSAKVCTFTFSQKLLGVPFHVYVGLVSLDGHHVSESQYLGKIDPFQQTSSY